MHLNIVPLSNSPVFQQKLVARVVFPLHSVDGHLFTPNFFLRHHIFPSHGFESEIVANLGSSFLRDYFIRAQWTSGVHELKLLPLTDPVDHLAVFTAGSCLNSGTGQNVGRASYGIYFANLPLEYPADCDISSPLFARKTKTNVLSLLLLLVPFKLSSRQIHSDSYRLGLRCPKYE